MMPFSIRKFRTAAYLLATVVVIIFFFMPARPGIPETPVSLPPPQAAAPQAKQEVQPTPPRCLSCPPLGYSSEARKKKIEGDVVLDVLITATGEVKDVKIKKLLGYGLDAIAVKTVQKCKFLPGTDKSGKPIDMRTDIQFKFQPY